MAVVGSDTSFTYSRLEDQARRFAALLVNCGVEPEDSVLLVLDRTAETLAAIFGVLYAGGAYVPVAPSTPRHRLDEIVARTNPRVVLANEASHDFRGATTMSLGAAVAAIDKLDPLAVSRREPASAAYVIFTSGSTGTPKGVVVERRQLAAYLEAVTARLGKWAWTALNVQPLWTDAGHTTLFGTILNGGCLHLGDDLTGLDPDAFARYMREYEIEVLKVTPTHFRHLLSARDRPSVVPRKMLILGGEHCPVDLVEAARRLNPKCRVANHYGPTETTVGVCSDVVDDLEDGRVPVGRPLDGVSVHIVDEAGFDITDGSTGELLIGGALVSRGYLGDPVTTAERFTWRFGRERVYRTGDLARLREDGKIEILDRIDRQVKVRGFRVEPAEIELALLSHAPVVNARVVPMTVEGEIELNAVVVAEPDHNIDRRELMSHLQRHLPSHAVPSFILQLPSLPVGSSGKVDEAALRDALQSLRGESPSNSGPMPAL